MKILTDQEIGTNTCVNKATFRFNCENGACNRPREHYCHGHKKVLCDDCYTSFHSDCICEEIKRKERVKNYLNVVKREILFAWKESKQIDAADHFPDIDSELSQFETKIKEIEVKVILITI